MRKGASGRRWIAAAKNLGRKWRGGTGQNFQLHFRTALRAQVFAGNAEDGVAKR